MDFRQAISILDRMEKFGMCPGLERIEALLAALGDPHRHLPCLHVVGTNGKTSTTRFAASALAASGIRCGHFTSPHLLSYRERICIDGEPVSEELFASAFSVVREKADSLEASSPGLGPVTLFELLTAMAFLVFAGEKVEAAVIEAGMGGRLDSTNVIDAPACAITPIGLDHTERLGTTIEAIAAEKAAVLRPGAVACSAVQPAAALRVIELAAEKTGARLLLAGRDFPQSRPDVVPPEAGRFQAENASLAMAAARAFLEAAFPGHLFDEVATVSAVASCPAPGRFQLLSREPPLYVDGAHNPAGAAALADSLGAVFPAGGITFVIAMCDDKDAAGFFRPLQPLARAVFTARHSHRRSRDPDALASLLCDSGVPVMPAGDVPAALLAARKDAGSGPVVLCGSLFAVGDALAARQGDPGEGAT